MDTAYRTNATPSPHTSWLWRLDAWLPVRAAQWFRRAVGGVWTERMAWLVPGCPTWWHCEGVDPEANPTHCIVTREVW